MNWSISVTKLMKRVNLNVTDVGKITDTHPAIVELTLTREHEPSSVFLEKLSNRCGVPLPILIWWAMEPEDIVDPEKRDTYNKLEPIINGLINLIVGEEPEVDSIKTK